MKLSRGKRSSSKRFFLGLPFMDGFYAGCKSLPGLLIVLAETCDLKSQGRQRSADHSVNRTALRPTARDNGW
ncbi:hypothetical protein ACFP7A_01145 [Sporolactobacillus kofuensis]|uniref:Uncharacterized protein n=1 Tax=Sporolactobacillus kofuensis TaxID=269672 RepID=A0ABW1W9J1_9BACL